MSDFDTTAIGRAFADWKIKYGLAIHGNYTFALPNMEVTNRWDAAFASEERFVNLLASLSQLTSKIRSSAVYTIEHEIERLNKERQLVVAVYGAYDTKRTYPLDKRIAEARRLLREALAWDT